MQEIIIRAVCRTLVHSLWQGLLLAAVAALLMFITKKSASALRYKLLSSLLIVFAAMVAITFCAQILSASNTPATVTSVTIIANQPTEITATASANVIFADSIHQLSNTLSAYFNQYSWLIVLIWFFIFLLRFVRLLLGMVNAERMRYYKTSVVSDEWNDKLNELCNRLQITKPVLLMESALLKVPVLIGYMKPVILIPVGMLVQLSGEQVEAILLHELAHVRRHDYLVNLIQNAIDALFFFNPAIVWISALIRSERENCCDDIAIAETHSRKQFVEALVSFNQYSNTIQTNYALSLTGGKSQLLQRVQRIVNRKNNNLRAGELLILMVVLLLTGSAFITLRHTQKITAQTPTQQTAASPQKTITAVKKAKPATAISPVTKSKLAKKTTKPVVTTAIANPVVVVTEVKDEEPVEVIETEQTDNNNDDNDDRDLGHLQTKLKSLGYLENNLGRLRTFRDHGLSAGYIESIRAAGYSNVSIDLLLQLHDHGLRAAFLTDLKKQGYGTVSLERATELVDHGVSISFIESIRQIGFKNISLEEITTLRDHGVSSSFIESFKKKTGTLLSLSDYVKLKDSGI